MSYDPSVVGAARKAALVAAAPTFQAVALSVPGAAAVADAAAEMGTADTTVLVAPMNDLDSRLAALEALLLAGVGFQAQSYAAASSDSTSSSSLVDCSGFGAWSFTVPVARTYLVHVDLQAYVAGVTDGTLHWQTVVDGSPVGPEQSFVLHDNLWAMPSSFRVPAALGAGGHTIKLQWRTGGAGTATLTTDCFRTFTVTG